MKRPRPGADAFTLIEIVIVIGLLALMAAAAWPVLEGRVRAAQLPDSADRLRSMLYMARSEAVMQHRRYRIRFEPEAQQPFIEHEPDPIKRPGEFEPVTDNWVSEPLLGDVQVHAIRAGRPFWMVALAEGEDPPTEDLEEVAEDVAKLPPTFAVGEDEEVDELRPAIVFEIDGSTDWATIILARILPEDDLLDEEPQKWIVIDGRTGLATIREKVTEEQLADATFYLPREKLELPREVDLNDLTLTAMPTGTESAGAGSGAPMPSMGTDPAGFGNQPAFGAAGTGGGRGRGMGMPGGFERGGAGRFNPDRQADPGELSRRAGMGDAANLRDGNGNFRRNRRDGANAQPDGGMPRADRPRRGGGEGRFDPNGEPGEMPGFREGGRGARGGGRNLGEGAGTRRGGGRGVGQGGNDPGGMNPGRGANRGGNPRGGAGQTPGNRRGAGGQGGSGRQGGSGGLGELERALENSGLSEQEKEEIRRTIREFERTGGGRP